MSEHDAAAIVRLLKGSGITVHVDGGWGVDALLGRQTRNHDDLDIAIPHRDAQKLKALLAERGYEEVPKDDSWQCNFVLGDREGHEIDVHSYTFDEKGNCIFGVPYPPDSLAGSGTIDGYEVACITPEWMVAFHSGYELDMDDYRDVKHLCEHFGIEMPSDFDGFAENHEEP